MRALRLRLFVVLGVILEPGLAQRLEQRLKLGLLLGGQRCDDVVLVAAMLLNLFALVLSDLAAEGEQVDERLFAAGFHENTSFVKKSPASISACRACGRFAPENRQRLPYSPRAPGIPARKGKNRGGEGRAAAAYGQPPSM